MDKLTNKARNKKSSKPKANKKGKCDGPTCSTFLSELSRKLAFKRRHEVESPKNIVQAIIDTISNALPIKFSKKTLSNKESPMNIERLQAYAPELLPNNTLNVPHPIVSSSVTVLNIEKTELESNQFIPKMPVVNSEVLRIANKRLKSITTDAAVNTACDHDVASEISKHVVTLKKISLIAEEFNQKTAKNLKEIVDSVQEDLIKKLEEIQAEKRAATSKQMSIKELSEPL